MKRNPTLHCLLSSLFTAKSSQTACACSSRNVLQYYNSSAYENAFAICFTAFSNKTFGMTQNNIKWIFGWLDEKKQLYLITKESVFF